MNFGIFGTKGTVCNREVSVLWCRTERFQLTVVRSVEC